MSDQLLNLEKPLESEIDNTECPTPQPVTLSLDQQIAILRRAVKVAVLAYLEYYSEDVFKVIPKEEVLKMIGETEDLSGKNVEVILKEALDQTTPSTISP